MEVKLSDLKSASMSEIQEFFKEKSVFITGATGFLGHVLLSKLLRSCPDIEEIYLLLREKKGKTPTDRFNDLLEDEVFKIIKEECPKSLLKIRPISGDCLKSGLGITAADKETLKNRVNVIFHVAATVRFDAPIRDAAHMNIRSTSDLLDLAHEIKNLKAFVHVSTAFSNCVGRNVVEEKLYDSPISPMNLLTLVDTLDEDVLERITPGLLGNYPNTYVFTKAVAEEVCRLKGSDLPLAIFRPAIVISSQKEPIPGWINNVYGPTGVVAGAAVGLLRVLYIEQSSKANVVPCDFVVNAAIASAWSVGTRDNELEFTATNNEATKIMTKNLTSDSFQNGCLPKTTISHGNISDNYSTDGNIHESDFKLINGITTNRRCDSKTTKSNGISLNNSVSVETTKKIPVYNFTCDLMDKPFTWKDFMKNNEIHEPQMPSSVSIWAYSLLFCRYKSLYKFYCFLFHLCPALIADNVAKLLGKKPKLMDAYTRVHKLVEVLSYFSTREWKMTNDNVHFLWGRLSEADKQLFNFDLNSIDWTDYFRIHCVGIRQFILKENVDTIPEAMKRRKKLVFAHYSLLSAITFLSAYVLLNFLRRFIPV
ncbi:hypothetical protein V9T40_008390 [Parthenolecanium corni]|uniref:Fatty acyl-CoA reductase n=1 Tax=Parthenolecanium corni TaxID=536013 RepID=A0AAN9Y728_9HEMI